MQQNTEQGIVFDSIKIGLASPEKFVNGVMVKLKNPKQSTTEHSSPKETVFSAKEFSDPQKTGSATVVNIKELDIKAQSATDAVLK